MGVSPMASRQSRLPELVRQDPRPGAVASVPSCLFPLRTPKAQTEYETLAELLLQSGRLTVDSYRVLSEYALQFDCLHVSLNEGLLVRSSRFDQIKRARKALRLRDLDVPAKEQRENKFARCGFSSRPR